MKDKELLSIIAEDAAEFRAQSLEQTLRVVRRRRRVRRCAQVLATIALFATVLWWNIPRPTPVDRPTTAALEVLITRESSVEIVSSTASSVVIVGDQELLELVPGEKKLLV
jgi:hypothetical protein